MIKINVGGYVSSTKVLSTEGIQVASNGELMMMSEDVIRKQALGRLLVIMAAPVIMIVYQSLNIPKLEDQYRQKQSQLTELTAFNNKAAAAVEEINRFQEEEKRIQSRISVVEKISLERMTEIKFLDLFQQIVPEKLWFMDLDSNGEKVKINGYAVNDFEVSSFMEKLQQSIYIEKVDLVSSSDEKKDDIKLKHFELGLELKVKKKVEGK